LLLSAFAVLTGLVACQINPAPAVTATPPSGTTPVNDFQMYYEIHGDGTPLILLHGGLGNTGDNDGAIYTKHTKEMANLIPSATLSLITGTGHFALWEKPEEFNKIVLEFLAP
jgi:pimeloyl-ACP methyl ester carboxylesterase